MLEAVGLKGLKLKSNNSRGSLKLLRRADKIKHSGDKWAGRVRHSASLCYGFGTDMRAEGQERSKHWGFME